MNEASLPTAQGGNTRVAELATDAKDELADDFVRDADSLGGFLVAATSRKLAVNLALTRREAGYVRGGGLPKLENFYKEIGNDAMLAGCFPLGGEAGDQAKVFGVAHGWDGVGNGF